MPKRKLDPLPLTAFHILLALAEEPMHGYGVMRAVEEQSGGRMRLGPGTLYGSIKTLLEAGMIEEFDERRDPELSNERRRYYRITAAGRETAGSEAERLADVVHIARLRNVLKASRV